MQDIDHVFWEMFSGYVWFLLAIIAILLVIGIYIWIDEDRRNRFWKIRYEEDFSRDVRPNVKQSIRENLDKRTEEQGGSREIETTQVGDYVEKTDVRREEGEVDINQKKTPNKVKFMPYYPRTTNDSDGWFTGPGGVFGVLVGLACFYGLVRYTPIGEWGAELIFYLAIAVAAVGALIGHVVVYWFEAGRILRQERVDRERAKKQRE